MFELNYRIINSEYDDFIGQNGFFQLNCNGFLYGEMYPKDLEDIMDKVSIFDWFERLIRIVESLMTKEYVALSDVESYNIWIEFNKKGEDVEISIVEAEKPDGSKDLEYKLKNVIYADWMNQKVKFYQFKEEILKKAEIYIENVINNNKESPLFIGLKRKIENLKNL